MRQTQTEGHYKINDLYPSKDVNKRRLRICSRLKEMEEIGELNAMCDVISEFLLLIRT